MYTVDVLLYSVPVTAGFPSPAAAYSARPLVLDQWLWPDRASAQLVPHPTSERDWLVIDAAMAPIPGDHIWFPEHSELLTWPVVQTHVPTFEAVGAVVRASIRLWRRRPHPGENPSSVHDWLISRPVATFFVRATGHSMREQGIYDGSLLVVDRGAQVHEGDVVIAGSANGFMVKRYRQRPPRLVSGNPDYADIPLTNETDIQLDGVVIASMYRYRCGDRDSGGRND